MAGLTQRKNAAVDGKSNVNCDETSSSKTYIGDNGHNTNDLAALMNDMTDRHNNNSNGATTSTSNGSVSQQNGSILLVKENNNNKAATNGTTSVPTAANSKGKSLKERSEIPYSFYITFGTIISLQYFGGLYSDSAMLRSWYTSLYQSIITLTELVRYSQVILLSPPLSSSPTTTTSTTTTTISTWKEYTFVLTIWCVVILPLVYVFFVAPFFAGFWTGRKSKRHVFHRYMGLCYLIHYVLAWIEFFTNPGSSKTSYLCHIIAVMGKIYILFFFVFVVALKNIIAKRQAAFLVSYTSSPLSFDQEYCKVLRPTFHSRYYPN